jgi:hypothetical protein
MPHHSLQQHEAVVVEKVKNKLKYFFLSLGISSDPFYLNIQKCMHLFWKYRQYQSGPQQLDYQWVKLRMNDDEAVTIITDQVMPSLEEAQSNMGRYTLFKTSFQDLRSYIEAGFGEPTPEPSNPTPQVTHSGASPVSNDIESLHQQVGGLTSKISALESAIKGFYMKNAAYDTAIATLQKETAQLPQILQRLEKLETPVKPARSWFSRTGKSSSAAEMKTLLQKMNDLNA